MYFTHGADEGFSDINALILDYLTMEGYPNAAANFSKEANLPPQQETSSIVARQEIQNLIHSGQVEMALKALNDYDPEVRSRHSANFPFYMIQTRVIHAPRIQPSLAGDDKQPPFMIHYLSALSIWIFMKSTR
jgi:glucose-induced degradation protein 8